MVFVQILFRQIDIQLQITQRNRAGIDEDLGSARRDLGVKQQLFAMRDIPQESLMLTGDENIVDIDFTLQWQVNPNKVTDFVFNLQNPEGTVRVVAESAMREVVGRRNIQTILTVDRAAIGG